MTDSPSGSVLVTGVPMRYGVDFCHVSALNHPAMTASGWTQVAVDFPVAHLRISRPPHVRSQVLLLGCVKANKAQTIMTCRSEVRESQGGASEPA